MVAITPSMNNFLMISEGSRPNFFASSATVNDSLNVILAGNSFSFLGIGGNGFTGCCCFPLRLRFWKPLRFPPPGRPEERWPGPAVGLAAFGVKFEPVFAGVVGRWPFPCERDCPWLGAAAGRDWLCPDGRDWPPCDGRDCPCPDGRDWPPCDGRDCPCPDGRDWPPCDGRDWLCPDGRDCAAGRCPADAFL